MIRQLIRKLCQCGDESNRRGSFVVQDRFTSLDVQRNLMILNVAESDIVAPAIVILLHGIIQAENAVVVWHPLIPNGKIVKVFDYSLQTDALGREGGNRGASRVARRHTGRGD